MWFTSGTADPAAVIDALHRHGCAVVVGLLDEGEVDDVRAALAPLLEASPLGAHEHLGYRTRRTSRLLARTRAVDGLVASPWLEAVLDRFIGEHQLNAPSAIELLPGEVDQFWHHDDMFYPMRRPHPPVVLNTFWAITDFTTENGATRLAPGSHRWPAGRTLRPSDRVVTLEMPAGSVALWDGSTWHSAGGNRTAGSRIGLSLEFSAAWLRPQETLTLSVPPALARSLPPRVQRLLGYGVTANGIGHVGGEHPTVVFGEVEPA